MTDRDLFGQRVPEPSRRPTSTPDEHQTDAELDRRRTAAGLAYRLVGPPGCGKTTALATSWVPQAVKRFGAESVVVCSLTKAAAAEIASREIDLPKRNIGTLHSLAYHALGEPTVAQGKDPLAKWNETAPVGYRISASGSFDASVDPRTDKAKGDELLNICEIHRHRQTPITKWPIRARQFYERWCEWKDDNDLLDFTDLIERAVEFTDHAPGDPRVLIGDEAQDLSALEMELMLHWGARCEFFVLAGDGDQAIFAWRGADPEAFLSADVPEDHVYTLTQSYRVPRAVQTYASNWIAKVPERYAVEYKPKDEDGECAIDRGASLRKCAQLVRRIEGDLEGDGDAMVLATCAYMLKPLLKELRKRGIPFHNPYRPNDGSWNPMRGGVDRLLSFLAPAKASLQPGGNPVLRFWSWRELKRWAEPLNADTFRRGGKTLIASRAEADERGEPLIRSELLDVFDEDQLLELCRALASTDDEDAISWYRSRLLVSHVKRFAFAIAIARKRGIAALIETPRIVVGTVHSTKGSGAGAVYLAPDLSHAAAKEYGKRGTPRDGIVRTFYVGMTRAKNKLILLGPSQANAVRWLPVTKED